VEKLLDIKHESNISQMNRAFGVMGKRLMISVGDIEEPAFSKASARQS
jgi:hypothetical protein